MLNSQTSKVLHGIHILQQIQTIMCTHIISVTAQSEITNKQRMGFYADVNSPD